MAAEVSVVATRAVVAYRATTSQELKLDLDETLLKGKLFYFQTLGGKLGRNRNKRAKLTTECVNWICVGMCRVVLR